MTSAFFLAAVLASGGGDPRGFAASALYPLEPVPLVVSLPVGPASLAFGGSDFLALWSGLAGIRVAPDGTLPDGVVLRDAFPPAYRGDPALVHDGSTYVAVWRDGPDIVAGRLGPDGLQLDPVPFRLPGVADPGCTLAIAGDGQRKLVTYFASGNPEPVLSGLLLDQDLCPVSAPFAIDATPADGPLHAPVAWNGSVFLVSWREGREIHAARIDPAGSVLDDPAMVVSANAGHGPAVATDGAGFLLAWSQAARSPGNPHRLYATRMLADGTRLDVPPLLVGGDPEDVDASFDGLNYVLAWPDGRGSPYFARVSPGGSVLDFDGRLVTSCPGTVRIRSGAGISLVLVGRAERFGYVVSGARIDTAGNALDPACFEVGRIESPQSSPGLASGPSGLVAAWRDSRGGNREQIVATRLDAAGQPIDQPPVTLAAGVADGYLSAPAVAPLGPDWIAVWRQAEFFLGSDLWFARLSGSGAALDPAGVAITPPRGDANMPALASYGGLALVAWAEQNPPEVRAARIDAAGTLLDPGGIVLAEEEWISGVSAVHDGTDFVVFWSGQEPGLPFDTIFAARVTAAGVVRDPGGRALWRDGSAMTLAGAASDGSGHLVFWTGDTLRAGRVSTSLVWLDGVGVPLTPVLQSYPPSVVGAERTASGWLAALEVDGGLGLLRLGTDLTLVDPVPVMVYGPDQGWLHGEWVRGDALASAGGTTVLALAAASGRSVSSRALAMTIDAGTGCAVFPRVEGPFLGAACANLGDVLDAGRSSIADCPGGIAFAWRVDGAIVPGATAATFDLATLAPGPHRAEAIVSCASDPACAATSLPFDLTLSVGPPPVPGPLYLTRAGALLRATWSDVAGVTKYVLLGGPDRQGPFPDELGRARSGTPPIDLPWPAPTLVYIRLAAEDRVCGLGPL